MSTPATIPIPQGATIDAQPQTVPIPAGANIDGEGAAIQPVTTSTNPKLNIAASGEDMPEYVGRVGATSAGLMAGAALGEIPAIGKIPGLLKSAWDWANANPWKAVALYKILDEAGVNPAGIKKVLHIASGAEK